MHGSVDYSLILSHILYLNCNYSDLLNSLYNKLKSYVVRHNVELG